MKEAHSLKELLNRAQHIITLEEKLITEGDNQTTIDAKNRKSEKELN